MKLAVALAIATGLLAAARSSIAVTPQLTVTDPIYLLVADGRCGDRQRTRLANAALELRGVLAQLRDLPRHRAPSYERRRAELIGVEAALGRCAGP